MRKAVIYTLAFMHLTLVALTIFHVWDKVYKGNAAIEKSSAFVCGINYSLWRFGFFSPDVGRSTEMEIKVYDVNGKETIFSTLDGFRFYLSNNDLAKRFYCIKVKNTSDTLFQDLCARSVATRMMNVRPGTYKVSYTIRSIRYPAMADFCKKEPVHVQTIYSTEFALKGF